MSATADAYKRPPSLLRVGVGHPLVIVDGISGAIGCIRSAAAALAPFPLARNHYPGLRRILDERDGPAWGYVDQLLKDVAPYIAGAFDCSGFDLIEASFSIVTTCATDLTQPQRAPHFDGTDPNLVAMLHYLGDVPGSGTAFFRHRATGIERLTEANFASYVVVATAEAGSGYVQGDNKHYEELHRIDAVADRLLVYHGSLLHSGIIPSGMPLDPDPMRGRLTANFFLRLTR